MEVGEWMGGKRTYTRAVGRACDSTRPGRVRSLVLARLERVRDTEGRAGVGGWERSGPHGGQQQERQQ